MLTTVRLLLAKVRPHDFRIAYNVLRQAIGDLAPGHQDGDALGELHHRPHDVLDHDHGDALAVQPDQQLDDLVDLGVREPGHHLVGDQQLGVCRHGAGKLELAHLDLGEIARSLARLGGQPDLAQKFQAARVDRRAMEMAARAGVHRIEDGNAHVLGERQPGEWPRQLEAARKSAPRALVRRQPVQDLVGEAHAALFIAQGAADAIDQGRLARAVGPDQAEPLPGPHLEVDAVQRHEAAEALADPRDLQQRRHRFLWNRPTMPCGATITKVTSSTPATSTLTAEEMVTRMYSCRPPTSTAPTTGPNQLDVPPISGMAMAFTA